MAARNNHIDENGIIHEAAITPESTVEGSSQVGKRKKNLSHSKKTKSSLVGEGTASKETSHQKKHTNKKSNGKIAPQPSEVVPKDDSWNNGVKKRKSTAASRKNKPEIDASHGKGAGKDPVVTVKSNNQKEIESEDDPQIHQPVEKLEASKSKKPSKKSAAKSAQSKPLQTGKMCPVISPVISQTGNSQQHLGPLYPPLGKTVVIVESITKAKTIQNYLGDMFQVLPSYGHVRNLAARSGSVRPEDDFSMSGRVWESFRVCEVPTLISLTVTTVTPAAAVAAATAATATAAAAAAAAAATAAGVTPFTASLLCRRSCVVVRRRRLASRRRRDICVLRR
ncbi:hypothetical protein EJ110_NYTH52695 [Nymphaea thermarum]|nr:hypothetical protein EJ110_NYTH52695 [Nymphaea thermarum]